MIQSEGVQSESEKRCEEGNDGRKKAIAGDSAVCKSCPHIRLMSMSNAGCGNAGYPIGRPTRMRVIAGIRYHVGGPAVEMI
jgi:hypothetical protein